MNKISDKQYRSYDYKSRYAPVPYYYNYEDDKYVYGVSIDILKNTSYVEHTIVNGDTLDSLSLYYYGRPDYYWVIAMYNNITDAFIDLHIKKSIKIPSLNAVRFNTND